MMSNGVNMKPNFLISLAGRIFYFLITHQEQVEKNDCVSPCQEGRKSRVVVKEDLWYLIYE